jgi:hypothetical protein
MPVGGRFPRPARIRVRFGPPLRFTEGGRGRDDMARFARRLEEAIRTLEASA